MVKFLNPDKVDELEERVTELEDCISKALARITESGGIDGGHHKQWVLDQVVRCLTGCPSVEVQATACNGKPYSYVTLGESEEYKDWRTAYTQGEDGPDTYETWDEGIPP